MLLGVSAPAVPEMVYESELTMVEEVVNEAGGRIDYVEYNDSVEAVVS